MNDRGEFDEPTTLADIAAWTRRAIEVRRGSPEDRRRAVQAVVSRYGIDIERFGVIP
jgi:hypothetical protein